MWLEIYWLNLTSRLSYFFYFLLASQDSMEYSPMIWLTPFIYFIKCSYRLSWQPRCSNPIHKYNTIIGLTTASTTNLTFASPLHHPPLITILDSATVTSSSPLDFVKIAVSINLITLNRMILCQLISCYPKKFVNLFFENYTPVFYWNLTYIYFLMKKWNDV